MEITLELLDNTIRDIFNDVKALDIETVYEKIPNSNDYKLVVFFHKLLYKEKFVIYTKLIFKCDADKKYLIEDVNATDDKYSFLYLYDINCKSLVVKFNDLDTLKRKLIFIFDNNKFGQDIKDLSDFMTSPAAKINEILGDKNIKNISVYSIKYEPKVKVLPCESLFFSFIINVNNNYDIELTLRKEKDKLYKLEFKFLNELITKECSNLKDIDVLIANALQEKVL